MIKKRVKRVLGEVVHPYIDLELPSRTLWATYNVGASKPTEYGDYFAWGETKPKEDYGYGIGTYKWCKASRSITKYCDNDYYGAIDNKTVLNAEDDAATVNWGSAWRMPTVKEIRELIEGCDWKRVKNFNDSGVNGRLGTSKKNGSTIFLPAAGYRDDTDLGSAGGYGNYWSSSLRENYSDSAYSLYFTDKGTLDCGGGYRYYGRSVRAVLNK